MRRTVAIFVISLLVFNVLQAQNFNSHTPKLVIGITVEHFRPDYIDRYWDSFQNDGFKRLVKGGAVFSQARIDIHNIKAATVVPSVYTGTYPSQHGIVGNRWYKQVSDQLVEAVGDDYYLTVGSDSDEGAVSARKLKELTLGDVLRQQTNFKSKVYSMALNAEAAVLSAGHAANAAYWYDKTNGNFISSSYYLDQFPDWVVAFNEKKFAEQYLQRDWELLLPESSYKAGYADDYLLEQGFWKRWNTFPYKLERIASDQEFPYELIKATPFGNRMLRDFAVHLIEHEELGTDDVPDLLNITFSNLDYANKWFIPQSVEMQESYLRLDIEIASLLNYLDQRLGKDNYLVFMTAASTSGYPVNVLKDEFNFEGGEFNPQSALALLKAYLNIVYGEGEWLAHYNEEQIYLNHRLIESKGVKLNELRHEVASFLNQFTGVKAAVPAHVIEQGNLNNHRFLALENSYSVQRSGDVMLVLDEGWYPAYRYHQVDYSTVNRVPLLFYGRNIVPVVNDDPVELTDIVPTLCKVLGIVPPDDARGSILQSIIR